jgi:2-polyprenyl-3-methyl-5-hydroxy-6-metoxy-1,4-benzoquinol methylase
LGVIASIERRLWAATRRPRVPRRIRDKYLPFNAACLQRVEESLRSNYFTDTSCRHESAEVYLQTPEGRADLEDHVGGRLRNFREWLVPWLDSLCKLERARILEIGCGTGACTVALAEQGADVVAVDISALALASARDRCAAYGLSPRFVQGSVPAIFSALAGETPDIILFSAVLEHLTWNERIDSLRAAWDLLRENSLLVILEAPNRLWYADIHTTNEPFYNWLPDEAAIAYTCYLPGPSHHLFEEPEREAKLHLARLGRGVSYHEFVIAWNIPVGRLPIVSYMAQFHSKHWRETLARFSPGGRYRTFLANFVPDLHPAWLQPSLDLAFRKKAQGISDHERRCSAANVC